MNVSIVGSGYVGLVTGACLAETGNTVVCIDKDTAKIESLRGGRIPFHEPGLAPLVEKNVAEGRLTFTTDLATAVRHGRVIFLAVGTPPRPNGEADLSFIEDAARSIGASGDEVHRARGHRAPREGARGRARHASVRGDLQPGVPEGRRGRPGLHAPGPRRPRW
jgi:UDPglucose 6-dehydrogenase